MNAAGRFTASKNEGDATLYSAYYAVRAAQFGITPEELYAKRPVRFAAESVGGQQLDQAAIEGRRNYRQAVDVLRALAASDDLFQQPRIDGQQGLVEILDRIDPQAKVTVFDNEAEPLRTANGDIVREFKVQMPSRKAGEKPAFAHVFELVKGEGKKKHRLAYVDVSGLKSGENRGNALYGAVAA